MRIYVYILFVIMLAACQPKKVEPAAINIVWKAKSVKQNGVVVYTEGNSGSAQPGYARFRLDLTAGDQATFMDVDGRKLVGIWSLSTDNNRLILEKLSPPPSGSSGNIEFYLTTAPTREQLMLKRTNESRKTGNSINEYELVPE
ncbi:hypothetical protein J2Y45_005674 [Dyadobacter sp. BE34]|uniref:Lipocalin-like domain-containing protein n=1 Tax=Dyadobacter fermentans TaxID=94254 RepID=A0ABU1R537_9BACT|nr:MULTISPECIES: hypothetical protein [Dyadobacter]MDR6808463.1 hypothetical protein [Dyadobacter fermentans]MDR7046205.1 hypothetical protein [Dyadobacter sp. BE242]MDR7200518.1 hypothetical protein [Dyadobacter sp. BE34]MDR7218478.1 hypothetical protein [Dyadobacter sp. BE31]MDR7266409.1 hypothetical protein [Dyadobacter sp. BE32]